MLLHGHPEEGNRPMAFYKFNDSDDGNTAENTSAAGGVLIAVLRYDHVPPPREPVTLRTLLAGVEFVWQRKALLGAVSLDLFAVLLGGATALLPMFAKDILHVGPWGLGLLGSDPSGV